MESEGNENEEKAVFMCVCSQNIDSDMVPLLCHPSVWEHNIKNSGKITCIFCRLRTELL